MSKELSEKDFENVNGGVDFKNAKYDVIYRDYEDGDKLEYRLPGTYPGWQGYNKARKDGRAWCQENGKIYVEVDMVGL